MEDKKTELEELAVLVKDIVRKVMNVEFRLCEEYERSHNKQVYNCYSTTKEAAIYLETVAKKLDVVANNNRVIKMVIEKLEKEGEK